MSRKTLKILLCALGAICVVLITFRSQINFYLLTGQFTPVSIVETLQSPVQVTSWVADGLVLADGRKVSIPGLNELPTSSQALSEFTKRGVEISPDGRLIGLTRVHHWCGNDPVREHIVRIDLSDAR